MSDDWNPGDLAECIDDNWQDLEGNRSPPGSGPNLGSVAMVTRVTQFEHPVHGHIEWLRLSGWGLSWMQSTAFRKVPPRYEEPRVQMREEVSA